MASRRFNEAERFLIGRWSEVTELETTIEEARLKYASICEKAAEAVQDQHPGLEAFVEVTRISGSAGIKSGVIILGKPSWPREKRYWTGFWLENLRLEILADDDEPSPSATFWINFEATDIKPTAAADAIFAIFDQSITPQERQRIKRMGNDDYILGVDFSSKHELLDSLATGNEDQFIERLTEPLTLLAKLTPAVDKLFSMKSEATTER